MLERRGILTRSCLRGREPGLCCELSLPIRLGHGQEFEVPLAGLAIPLEELVLLLL
jgi:hypothetical protein